MAENPNKTTFFELPLQRDLYVPKVVKTKKEPLRVLVTEAGSRIAYNLIYLICKGDVFGYDQEIILHLLCSKGSWDHKTVILEIEECGFHLLKDAVISGNPAETYNDIDVAIIIKPGEEQSGITFNQTIVNLVIKVRQIASCIADYGKKDVKIIVASPSTKTALIFMYVMKKLETELSAENFSCVVLLDEAIARANIAAKLKVTTDCIKNIIIWGMTCPDVHNATALIYPPGDIGTTRKVEVPVSVALQDDKWLRDEFVESIFKREVHVDLLRSGKSLAIATARHLKALFQGTKAGEYASMGVLTPDGNPYLVSEGMPFAFPVTAKNGKWKIIEGLKYDVRTHLNILRTLHRFNSDKGVDLYNMLDYIIDYEKNHNGQTLVENKEAVYQFIDAKDWDMKYYLSPLPEEAIPKPTKERGRPRRTSVWWPHGGNKKSLEREQPKSSIRFSLEEPKKTEQKPRSSILKTASTERFLPLISSNKEKENRSSSSKGVIFD